MRILPILFNTDMVRALMEERKTMTRRVIKGADTGWMFRGLDRDPAVFRVRADGEAQPKTVKGLYATFEADPGVWFPMYKVPYEPGDILYVRETWAVHPCSESEWLTPDTQCKCNKIKAGTGCYIFATDGLNGITPCGVSVAPHKWRPSIHMPKEAARIFLRVTGVRVERLQEITEDGAVAEGIAPKGGNFALDDFESLWDTTIKPADRDKYGWIANPWVWVIEFERAEKPEGWMEVKT